MSSRNLLLSTRSDVRLDASTLPQRTVRLRAMATRITIQLGAADRTGMPDDILDGTLESAAKCFSTVDEACTRFVASSPLMQLNRSPEQWHTVPVTLYKAIREAKLAYDTTDGRFDPRVLKTLVALGYASTLDFNSGDVQLSRPRSDSPAPVKEPWQPAFERAGYSVRVGEEPIDLGGIGKGLAVRWASEILKGAVNDFLVEAGGDCYCAGLSVDGGAWRIGIEGPVAGEGPIAVLALSDLAVTTSSIRLRRWTLDNARVHHLINPRTGRPGGDGLFSVTVVGDDPARAEVWSKALFISGKDEIETLANDRGIAAAWIDESGRLATSLEMEPHLLWWR